MKWWQTSFLALCFLVAGAALASVPWLRESGQSFAAVAFVGMAICLAGLGWSLLRQWRRGDTHSDETSPP